MEKDVSGLQRFKVKNFSKITEYRSAIFNTAEYEWRVRLSREGGNLSLSLEVVNTDKLPSNWSASARFTLRILDQHDKKFTIKKFAENEFNANDDDCGFTPFMTLEELHNPKRGYIVGDVCIIEAYVENYRPRKKTDYAELSYQGGTCCMIPLVQALYHIPLFRKAVYRMSRDVTKMPSTCLALLTLFFKLQYGQYSVATKELCSLFECDISPQDCFREFHTKLENEMEETAANDTFQMFKGYYTSHIEFKNMVHTSRRQEFYDLQLEFEGCRGVNSSIAKFEEAVSYTTEHGQQTVLNWVRFVDYPPILMLKLKPFDPTVPEAGRGYELPLELNLQGNPYTLHSVLVGGKNDICYSVYTRPTLKDKWFNYTDGQVTTFLNLKSAMEAGDEHPIMLVYIHDSEKDKVLCDVDENDVGDSFKEILKSQAEEDDKRQDRYTIFKVTRDEDLIQQFKEGAATMFILVDHDKVHSFTVPNIWSFKKFKESIEREFDIPVEFQRYWLWSDAPDYSFHMPLMPDDEEKSVGDLRYMYQGENPLKLFLEVELNQEGVHVPLPQYEIGDHILLFVLLHRVDEDEWRYLGRIIVSKSSYPQDVLAKLQEMAGFEYVDLMQVHYSPSPDGITDGLDTINLETSWEVGEFDSGDVVIIEV